MEKGKVKRNVTLIIVIAVILFVVWFLIVYPLIDFNKKEESVLDASKKYYEKNINLLPEEESISTVKLRTLLEQKYVGTIKSTYEAEYCDVDSSWVKVKRDRKYTNGSVHGFASPRWTLEYCIALSSLSDVFHKAVHYGKKILNAQEHISLTDAKIDEANRDVEAEAQVWNGASSAERAYRIYKLMLNGDGKSSLKAITAQCLASLLRWKISIVPDGMTQEKMFDLELYGFKTDEDKKAALKSKIENDPFLSYIVNAIKYAAGETV